MDKFTVGQRIGSGGQGTVISVFKKSKSGKLMIKAMKRMRCESIEDANKAINEMNAVIRLSHKNMVHYEELFFDQVTTQGLDNEGNPVENSEEFVCIVMPYYMNNDLEHFIKEYTKQNAKNIPQAMVLDITKQIVDFVTYFHANGMIHRDLKPKNILMANKTLPKKKEASSSNTSGNVIKEAYNQPFDYTDPNLKFELKIGDFGLSTYFSMESLRSTTCGTPYYMAPEIHSDSYSTPVDVFSIGCILSFMLTGSEYPWYSMFTPNKKAKAFKNMKNMIIERGYDTRWYYLLVNILSEEPTNRFSAQELKEALEHFEDIAIPSSPTNVAEKKKKTLQPKRKKETKRQFSKSDVPKVPKKKKSSESSPLVPFSGEGRLLRNGTSVYSSSSSTKSSKKAHKAAFVHHLQKGLTPSNKLDLNSKLTAAQAVVGQTEALQRTEKPNSFIYGKTSKPIRTSFMTNNTGRVTRETERELGGNVAKELLKSPPPIVRKSMKLAKSKKRKKQK